MSDGISGSYTVFKAATMSSVMRSSSSGGIAEPGDTCGALDGDWSFKGSSSSKQGFCLLQGVGQLIDFLHGVVEAKRGPAGGGRAEPVQQRHGAMGAGPDSHALAVDDRRYVMSMSALHLKRDDRGLALGMADDAHRVHGPEALMRILRQSHLVSLDVLAPETHHEAERRIEADRLDDRR